MVERNYCMDYFNKDLIEFVLEVTETLQYLERNPSELPTFPPLKRIHTEIIKRYLSTERRFIGSGIDYRNRELFPNNYQKLLTLFQLPLSEWGEGIFTKKELKNLDLENFRFLDTYGLTDDCHYIYSEKESLFEFQSSAVAKALHYCRQYQHQLDNAQKLYTKFRLFIQEHPVLNERELKQFMMKGLLDTQLSNYLEECYEPIRNYHYLLCPRCGWTMTKITDSHYRCLTEECEKQFDVTDTMGSLFQDAELRTKKAVQFSTVISGLWEMELKTRLEKKGAVVELYPNLERYGDLEVKFQEDTFLIDVKNYRSSHTLLSKLQEELSQGKYHESHTTIIAVPDHKSKAYVDFINEQVPLTLRVMRFKEIVKKITNREVHHA